MHSFVFLICSEYPWNHSAAKQIDADFIKCVIKKCGSSLANMQTGQSLKLQNGFNALSLCLKHRPNISQNAQQNICKLIEQTIKSKLFQMDKNKFCVNLDSYLAILRVYGFVHILLPMSMRTFFLKSSVEFLCFCPSIVQMDICEHLLAKIKWKSAEINKNDKEFAMQMNCIYILFQKCFLSNDQNIIRQTTLSLKASQKYLPFDASILIPKQLKPWPEILEILRDLP